MSPGLCLPYVAVPHRHEPVPEVVGQAAGAAFFVVAANNEAEGPGLQKPWRLPEAPRAEESGLICVAESQAGNDVHWRWRLQAAEDIAAQIDPQRFGVNNFYVFGSSNNATAGPESDIDLLVHFQGNETQQRELFTWLEGWSLSLAEANYLRTGYKINGLLDVHLVTDEDIRNRTGYASKIGAVTDAARPLPIGIARRRNGYY